MSVPVHPSELHTDGDQKSRPNDSSSSVTDIEGQRTVSTDDLKRNLSARQVQMVAIGGTIGTGLFIGTGKSLAVGGPASMLIAYCNTGAMVYFTMLALGEMAAFIPVAGSFCIFASRFVDDAFGFAVTWNYWFNDAVTTAADLLALQIIAQYWTDSFPLWTISLVFWILLIIANIIPVAAYAGLEYWLSFLKILTIIAFIIVGIFVNCGGNSSGSHISGKNWHVPGAPFVGGIGGFASVCITAAFAYGGTESMAITAGETKNPVKNIPRVVKNVFWRILIFYAISVILIGLNIPYTYPDLKIKGKGVHTSPFTIIFQMTGAKFVGSIVNAVIMTSVVSAGNHALSAGTRLLFTLSKQGHAPRIFSKLNRRKVPWVSVLATSLISVPCFASIHVDAGQLWIWLHNIVGVSNMLCWIAIGITSIRFRAALSRQNKTHLLSFQNWTYPYGPWICVIVNSVLVLVQGWSCFSPRFNGASFISYYSQLPAMLLMIVVWKIYKKAKWIKLEHMDLMTDAYVADKSEEATSASKSKFKSILGWIL